MIFKRIAIGLLVGILAAFMVGTLYYWRASQPYRALARRAAEEAEQDLSTIVKKEFDPVTMRKLKEKQLTYARQSKEIESMRQRARRNARIAAGAAGIVAFSGWMFVGGRLMPGRKKQTPG